MKIISDGKQEMIFRKENKNGTVMYSVGISRKTEDGYENEYFPVKFKKGIDIPNMSKITINDGFMSFDKWTDADGKTQRKYYIMVLDYSQSGEVIKEENKKDPFEEFAEELDDSALPF